MGDTLHCIENPGCCEDCGTCLCGDYLNEKGQPTVETAGVNRREEHIYVGGVTARPKNPQEAW